MLQKQIRFYLHFYYVHVSKINIKYILNNMSFFATIIMPALVHAIFLTAVSLVIVKDLIKTCICIFRQLWDGFYSSAT